MNRPLYARKAELFKTLGHPARIRVLELLSLREHAVGELLPEVGVEATSLSHQLAVLRRAGLVVSRKEGSTVYYSLTSPQIAEFLAQIVQVVARDRVGNLVGLLDRIGGDRREALLDIPGAAGFRVTQGGHDLDQAGDVAGRFHRSMLDPPAVRRNGVSRGRKIFHNSTATSLPRRRGVPIHG